MREERQMARIRAKRRGTAGFSLLELLVVLAILGLLVGVVGPRVIGALGKAKGQTAEVQISNIELALDTFLLDVGRYPTQEEGLEALLNDPGGVAGWAGPYLNDESLPMDPWNRPYKFRSKSSGTGVDVYSLGADNAEGGSGENADIGV